MFSNLKMRLAIFAVFSFAVAVNAQSVDPLRITSNTFVTVPQSTLFSFNIAAAGGRAPYAFNLQAGSLPFGLNLSPNGVLSGVTGLFGDFFATVQVTDADGQKASTVFQIRIVITPTISTDSNLNAARIGTPYQQTLQASGGYLPVNGVFTWALVAGTLPPGLTLTIGGTIQGAPLPPAGTYNFSIRVTDSANNSAVKAFVLRVDGPIIITDRLVSGQVNRPYVQGIVALGGIGPYLWQVKTGPIPPGLSLTDTGVLIGTPFVPGSYTFEIRVSDSVGSYFDKTYTLTSDAFPTSISIVTATLPDAAVGVNYVQTIQASGGTSPYLFSISSGFLPPGITFSSTGILTGVPTTDGVYTFSVLAVDSFGLQASRAFSLNSKGSIIITKTDLAKGYVGAPYSQQLVAQGGTPPYIWTPFGTPLPPGLSINQTSGILSGTPAALGDFFFAIQVSDSRGRAAQANYALTVAPLVPLFADNGMLNGASFKSAAIAPGEIVTLFGFGFGPADLTGIQLQNNSATTFLASTRVLFDELPAPLLFAAANQVGLIVPYEVAGRTSVNVVVEYKGLRSSPVKMNVTSSAPGIFTADSSGKGPAAALNENGTFNGRENPAKPGSIVVLYATGEGQTVPAGVSGKLAIDTYPKPLQPVTVTIAGQPAEVIYAGAAPNLITGLLQVNVRIPANIATLGTLPVVLNVGGIDSPNLVTISVAP